MENVDFTYRVKRVVQWTFFILSFAVLGWAITPYPVWFAGLILGTSASLINTVYSAWKIHRVGSIAIQYQGKKKMASLGTMTRYSVAILATVVALQFPHLFSMVGMVVGLLIPPIVAYGDAVFVHLKNK